MPRTGVPPLTRRRPWIVPAIVAAAAFLLYLVPGLVGPYGPFIDELYYIACAKRLAWGYVDHPPLAPFLLRVALAIGGEHLATLRVLSSTFGALTVFGTGLLAARLGAGPWGQGLASGAMLAGGIAQVIFGFYSMNAIEPLLWLALCWLLIEIARGATPRLWLVFGAIAGIALLNKHTVVTFGVALGVGLLLTPARHQLRSRWPWLGLALAVLFLTPNLLWQAANGWPSIEFYRNAALYKNQPAGPLEVVLQQVLFMNPGTLPVWVAGLVYLWRREHGELRFLALLHVTLLVLLVLSQQSRPDRVVGMYPLLFGAGATALETMATRRRWVRITAPAWLAVGAIVMAPVGLPLLPPDATSAYAQALGAVPQMERGEGKRSALPQWFADRLGWEALVDDVRQVRDSLPHADRSRVVYFAPSYGQAGALEWLGRPYDLDPVYSTHNSYYLWGPPPATPEVAIVIGGEADELRQIFGEVTLARTHQCEGCMPWRNDMPIWIVRQPRVSLADIWPELKHFE